MTNKEKWDSYTSGLSSPQNFIDWGYRYLVAASLQRRVWMSSEEMRCYPNMYIPLVGKPGIGKGNVIRAVSSILSYHKLETGDDGRLSKDEQATMDAVIEADKQMAKEELNTGVNTEKPLLIPIASDAVTYEALVQSMARSYRRINHKEYSEKHGKDIMKIYGHSSLCFVLEEMASLFRKNTESMVNFLIQAYDCGDKYEYRTKTAGIDRVLRLCLNFFAGTTPDFMQEVFDDRLLSQGFSSRSFFIYAVKNRKSQFFIPSLTEEQKKAKEELIKHVKELTKLYGPVKLDNETRIWLQEWWESYDQDPSKRASQSSKMEAYYARKNIHVMKVAMALHFGESTSLYIPRETFEKAMEILHEEEKTMHLALSLTGSNPLSKLSSKVTDMLRSQKRTYPELLFECFSLGSETDLNEVLDFLSKTGQIESKTEKDPDTELEVTYFSAKR